MGLEAPFCAPVLIVVTEIFNLIAASCTSYVAILVAMLKYHKIVFDTSSRSYKFVSVMQRTRKALRNT